MKTILFILNPISGTTDKTGINDLIAHTLDLSKFSYDLKVTEFAGHASEIALQAKEAGTDIVVAIGGDGTVNEVARSIVHSQTALGILPCGSGNGLARHLKLPMNLKKAMEVINRCEIQELDYGVINEHPFFCTCGMGFDASISQRFAQAGKRGLITYLESILHEWRTYKPEVYDIQDDTGQLHTKAFLIACANASQYGNNAYIAPHALMSDGLMDVTIVEPFDLLAVPQLGVDLFTKSIDQNPKIKTFRSRHLRINRTSAGVIHYDGEPAMATATVDINLIHKGIRVLVNTPERITANTAL